MPVTSSSESGAEDRDIRRILLVDSLLAVGVATMSVPSLLLFLTVDTSAFGAEPLSWRLWSVAYAIAFSAPLSLRRIWPRAVHLLIVGLAFVPLLVEPISPAESTPLLVSLFSVASTLRGWRFTLAAVVATVVAMATPLLGLNPLTGGLLLQWQDVLLLLPYSTLPVALAVAAGRALRYERNRSGAHQRAALQAQLAGDARAEAAVAAERHRLASELHDIVAHHVSLMVVQAEAGPYAAHSGAATTYGAIADRGRTALAELDRLLGVLRRDGDAMPGTAPLAPLPTLGELPALVASAEQAGVPVLLTRFDVPDTLDTALSATGHRIAQECITNVIKHGDHQKPAHLAVVAGDGVLKITSDNRVARRGGGAGPTRDGYGLLSIRSRVDALGGTLRTFESDDRFHVEAVLPLPGLASASAPGHGVPPAAAPAPDTMTDPVTA